MRKLCASMRRGWECQLGRLDERASFEGCPGANVGEGGMCGLALGAVAFAVAVLGLGAPGL